MYRAVPIGNVDDLSARWEVEYDITLRLRGTIRLSVKNHDPANTLFGAAGDLFVVRLLKAVRGCQNYHHPASA
jgi:hypothetical protein